MKEIPRNISRVHFKLKGGGEMMSENNVFNNSECVYKCDVFWIACWLLDVNLV